MKIIVDNIFVGIAKDIEIKMSVKHPSHHYRSGHAALTGLKLINSEFLTNSFRYDSVLIESNKSICLSNAYVISYMSCHTSTGINDSDYIEFDAEIVAINPKCKYCYKFPVYVTHDYMIHVLQGNCSKDVVLNHLGISPRRSESHINEAIEILRGHFPELYLNMEKYLLLL